MIGQSGMLSAAGNGRESGGSASAAYQVGPIDSLGTMRILHIIPQFPYFGGGTIIGGYSTSVLGLARAQAEAGDQVTILGYVRDEAGRGVVQDGLEVISLFDSADPGTIRFGLDFIREAARWAGSRRSMFDVVHNHSGFPDYFLASDISARLRSSPAAPRQTGRRRARRGCARSRAAAPRAARARPAARAAAPRPRTCPPGVS